MAYDKPFLTYEEQIERLKNRYKLQISPDARLEKTILESLSYYDLINGYKDCFLNDYGVFEDGVSLIDLLDFKIFDMNFQSILFKYSVYAENSFKTKLAYVLCEEFGVDIEDYLNSNNFVLYNQNEKFNDTIENIRRVYEDTSDNPTMYYRENHDHVPAWILFKNVLFNDCINLFTFLKEETKLKLIKRFFRHEDFEKEDYFRLFKNLISIIRKFRNKIAHNAKVITYRVDRRYELQQIKLMKINPYSLMKWKDTKNKITGRNDLFSMILSLTIVLDNPVLVGNMLNEIRVFLESNANVSDSYIKITNLPPDIINRIQNIDIKKYWVKHLEKWNDENN